MQKSDPHRAIDIAKACLMLVTLIGCGFGLGYWVGIERSRDMLLAERYDKVQEIERLNRAHGVALQAVSGRQALAAGRISEAADTAAAAAETAQGAAAIAGKVAKAAGVPAATIERDRKAINSTIQRANQRLAGEGGP
jgi:hypothetical protein